MKNKLLLLCPFFVIPLSSCVVVDKYNEVMEMVDQAKTTLNQAQEFMNDPNIAALTEFSNGDKAGLFLDVSIGELLKRIDGSTSFKFEGHKSNIGSNIWYDEFISYDSVNKTMKIYENSGSYSIYMQHGSDIRAAHVYYDDYYIDDELVQNEQVYYEVIESTDLVSGICSSYFFGSGNYNLAGLGESFRQLDRSLDYKTFEIGDKSLTCKAELFGLDMNTKITIEDNKYSFDGFNVGYQLVYERFNFEFTNVTIEPGELANDANFVTITE